MLGAPHLTLIRFSFSLETRAASPSCQDPVTRSSALMHKNAQTCSSEAASITRSDFRHAVEAPPSVRNPVSVGFVPFSTRLVIRYVCQMSPKMDFCGVTPDGATSPSPLFFPHFHTLFGSFLTPPYSFTYPQPLTRTHLTRILLLLNSGENISVLFQLLSHVFGALL